MTNNLIKFKLTKIDPETLYGLGHGEGSIHNGKGEIVPGRELTIVVEDLTKAHITLQGHDTIINGEGFYISGKNEMTLDLCKNKQVDNLLNYYQKSF
ncbi:hypothetical protein LMB21_09820 [Limosilactobacillus reuteri]|uniref:hypothetical protein n=1 Tax=Limosilactobacillus reuteri TaxID=1598 RepID=UPI001E5CDCD0|nr:hypothetical protein [Limosilactobacillus reuteri]MCC4367594.1 hypothetical protein [Limosilactobacillus reuteri]